MYRELLQVRVNEASKCSKMKISSCQSVVCENCSKLEINYLHNLKASISFIINSYYTIIKYKIVVKKDKRIQCF